MRREERACHRGHRVILGALVCLVLGLAAIQAADPGETTNRTALAQAAESTARTDDTRLAEADRLDVRVARLCGEAKYADAVPLAQEALKIREEVHGKDHADIAVSLNNLAELYRGLAQYTLAEPLALRALKVQEATSGLEHTNTAMSLNSLAVLYVDMGEYAKAKPLYQRALKINEQALGPEHSDTALSLSKMGFLYSSMADYAHAETLYQRALEIYEKRSGPEHPDTALSLHNLAGLYSAKGDYAKAEPLLQRALKIREKVLSPEHPYTALSLHNLAGLYSLMGDYAKAEPLLQRALEITKKALGPEHPLTALSLNSLGFLYSSMGDYAKAEPLLQRALKINEQALGSEHPDTALSLNSLGFLYSSMGDYAKAEPLYQRALEITEKALGPEHPDVATSLNGLALIRDACGDSQKAEALLRRALAIQQDFLDVSAASQSQRQQLATLDASRRLLHAWLSVAIRAGVKPAELWVQATLGKGQVAVRQASLRRLRMALEAAKDETTLELFSNWERTSRQVATLAWACLELDPAIDPKSDPRFERLRELTRQNERLERDLAARSALYRQEERRATVPLDDLRQALSLWPQTALVDLLEYTHLNPPKAGKGNHETQSRVLAFVLRGDTEGVRQIELGEAQPIREAVVAWRAALGASTVTHAAGQRLRDLVWQKLEPVLAGVSTVLVSPDGALDQMPWGALPGREPKRFLIEEFSFSIVPVPRLLPETLAGAEFRTNTAPSLLVLGDVDYGADPGMMVAALSRSAARSGRAGGWSHWEALGGTRDEILAVQDSFRQRFEGAAVKELRRQKATEAAFREAVVSQRYLHLATHGFFAEIWVGPQSAGRMLRESADSGVAGREEVTDWHPGLLTGLALAGANRPFEEGKDDGILTALEVQALDLRGVELAVLSACETGLGESVAGEGILGLQRAFQLAGARTTIGSLWKVPDEATRTLMSEFYRQLWEEKKGKLEALRAAQLWMMREGKARGVKVEAGDVAATEQRLPPKYWAAFVLSGDWR